MRDFVIIGGGFYGCCLALYLRSIGDRVTIIEAEPDLLMRASRVNQARIHTGFHYPRSFVTAKRSLQLYKRFMSDFGPAVRDDFRMLYAIARYGSKVSARRFMAMYRDMGAPFVVAAPRDRALFAADKIEEVFDCEEFSFDFSILRDLLRARLDAAGIDIKLSTRALGVASHAEGLDVELDHGDTLRGRFVFNASYSGLDNVLVNQCRSLLPLKNELTEVALIEPPEILRGLGITVLDGPFFSTMPFPSLSAYSLTHVRFTPHFAWTNSAEHTPAATVVTPHSRWRQMARAAEPYLPCAADFRWRTSLFEIKTVLQRNEVDDGRPIFVHRDFREPRFLSVLGGKLDNIYDLAEALVVMRSEWASLDTRWFRPS